MLPWSEHETSPLDDIEAEGRDEVVSALKTPIVPSSPLLPRESLDHGRMGGRKMEERFYWTR